MIEVMKQALEALELTADRMQKQRDAITFLRQAIEQAEKREWVGLTPDEVFGIADQHPVEGFDPDIMAYTRAIEQALKEKNHG